MSRQATKKRKAAAAANFVPPTPRYGGTICVKSQPPTAGRTPDPEAFKRGHGMGSSFLDAFGPDEMRDGLEGFNAAIRERLNETIKKHEHMLELFHGAMEVVESR